MNCTLPKLPLIVSTKCKPLTDKITTYYNAGNCFSRGFNSSFMGFLIPLDVVGIHLASKTNRSAAASSLLMIFFFLIGVSYSSWVLMCFLRKLKWSFPPWNKCTYGISIYFLEGFHWTVCMQKSLCKKKKGGGGEGWKQMVYKYQNIKYYV